MERNKQNNMAENPQNAAPAEKKPAKRHYTRRPKKAQPKAAPAAAPAAAVTPAQTVQPATAQPAKRRRKGGSAKPTGKIRIASLGGLHEIGKNMTMIEYGDDIIVVDCGIAFPDEDMLGVDLVIPDVTYLEKNKEKIRGILLTHGHEDHIGSLPYVLRSINPDIYGTALTLGIVEKKLSEHSLPHTPRLHTVQPGDTVEENQVLMTIEAMKMETAVTARTAGKVREIRVKEGQAVKAKELLMLLD